VSQSVTVQIAQEVADLLSAGSTAGAFSRTFVAQRKYIPRVKLDDLGALYVSVVPNSRESRIVSRSHTEGDHLVEVGIQKRLAKAEDLAEIDDLTAFVQELELFLLGDDPDTGASRRLLASSQASLMRAENSPIFAPEHLRDDQVFTSVLALTYQLTGAFR
jgi:hypothetical protein